MCGISGYFAFSGAVEETDALRLMSRAVAHRGPDGEGALFLDTSSCAATPLAGERTPMMPTELPAWPSAFRVPHNLAFGHRRFAIVDRSPGGHQPHRVVDVPVALTFNGEIYNHVELREELSRLGHIFRTQSDAEVLGRAYLEWGVECFSHLRGFWALALWDGRVGRDARGGRGGTDGGPATFGERREHAGSGATSDSTSGSTSGPVPGLLLARDPLGKAPLYWARRDGRLWWSSEIKGLRAGIALSGGAHSKPFAPRAEAIAQFVRAGLRDFENKTFFEGIETFPAGSHAWVCADGNFEPVRYWSPPRERLRASDISTTEAIAGVSIRLQEAVRLRLRADTPVALELSGGMDSSAITGLAAHMVGMRAGNSRGAPLDAFTVSFPGTPWDESAYAHLVAAHYPHALRLRELEPNGAPILSALTDYQRRMDEPFHSPALLANEEIWKRMAAFGTRVSLNGAGGDEVFAGYGEYLGPYARSLMARGNVVRALRELGSFSEREANSVRAWARAAWWMLPDGWRKGIRPPGPSRALDPLRSDAMIPTASDGFAQRLLDHLGDYKMNYWLRSGNASCMGVPIEVRLPLLDAQVVEWAAHLPPEYLIRDGWLKWVLRKAVEPYLPAEVVWRRVKMGFPFPLKEWLQASRPGLEFLRHGEDPPGFDRARVFAGYDALAVSHPTYLWRCLSVLLWWDTCVVGSR